MDVWMRELEIDWSSSWSSHAPLLSPLPRPPPCSVVLVALAGSSTLFFYRHSLVKSGVSKQENNRFVFPTPLVFRFPFFIAAVSSRLKVVLSIMPGTW